MLIGDSGNNTYNDWILSSYIARRQVNKYNNLFKIKHTYRKLELYNNNFKVVLNSCENIKKANV